MCLVRMESPGLTILPFHRLLVAPGPARIEERLAAAFDIEERPLPADRVALDGGDRRSCSPARGGTGFGLYRGGSGRHAAAPEARLRLLAAPAPGDLAAGRRSRRDGAAPGDLPGAARPGRAAPRAGGRHPLLLEGRGRGGGGRGRPRRGGVLPAADAGWIRSGASRPPASACRRSRRTSIPSSSPASSSTSSSRNDGRSRALPPRPLRRCSAATRPPPHASDIWDALHGTLLLACRRRDRARRRDPPTDCRLYDRSAAE